MELKRFLATQMINEFKRDWFIIKFLLFKLIYIKSHCITCKTDFSLWHSNISTKDSWMYLKSFLYLESISLMFAFAVTKQKILLPIISWRFKKLMRHCIDRQAHRLQNRCSYLHTVGPHIWFSTWIQMNINIVSFHYLNLAFNALFQLLRKRH